MHVSVLLLKAFRRQPRIQVTKATFLETWLAERKPPRIYSVVLSADTRHESSKVERKQKIKCENSASLADYLSVLLMDDTLSIEWPCSESVIRGPRGFTVKCQTRVPVGRTDKMESCAFCSSAARA